MKYFNCITAFLFILFLATPSWSKDWVKVSRGSQNAQHYIDKDSVKKRWGYIWFWTLTDYPARMFVDRSVARYIRADCNSLPKGLKIINHIFFEGPMATGKLEKRDNSDNEPIKYWDKDNINLYLREVMKLP